MDEEKNGTRLMLYNEDDWGGIGTYSSNFYPCQSSFSVNKKEEEKMMLGLDEFEAQWASSSFPEQKSIDQELVLLTKKINKFNQKKTTPHMTELLTCCGVCLEEDIDRKVTTTVCVHQFHAKCLLKWFKVHPTNPYRNCPVCRVNLPAEQIVCTEQQEEEMMMIDFDLEKDMQFVSLENIMQDEEMYNDLLPSEQQPDITIKPETGRSSPKKNNRKSKQLGKKIDRNKVHGKAGGKDLLNCKAATMKKQVDMNTGGKYQLNSSVEVMNNGVYTNYEGKYECTSRIHTAPSMMQQPGVYQAATTLPDYWQVLQNGQNLAPFPAVPFVPVAPKAAAGVWTSCHKRKHDVDELAPSVAAVASNVVTQPKKLKPTFAVGGVGGAQHMFLEPTRTYSCRCVGGCRNGRCTCVKEGSVCGISCKCTSCKNPFLPIAQLNVLVFSHQMTTTKQQIDLQRLSLDVCFMQNLSKTKDMAAKLRVLLTLPCCSKQTIQLYQTLVCSQGTQQLGYLCASCDTIYEYSWCTNKLYDTKKHPRTHCKKCKRCGDHRDVHCKDCDRCYFAGISNSFACPCKQKNNSQEKVPVIKEKHEKEAEVDQVQEGTNSDTTNNECSIM